MSTQASSIAASPSPAWDALRSTGRVGLRIVMDSDCILKIVRFAHSIIGFMGSLIPLPVSAHWANLGLGGASVAAWGWDSIHVTRRAIATPTEDPTPHWSEALARISLCAIRWLGVYAFISSCLELASLVNLRSLVASLGSVPLVGSALSVFPLLCVGGLINGAANISSQVSEMREIKFAIDTYQSGGAQDELQRHKYTIATPEALVAAQYQLKVERARMWLITCAEVAKIANYALAIVTISFGIVWSVAATPYLLALGVIVAGLALVEVIFDKARPQSEFYAVLQARNAPPVVQVQEEEEEYIEEYVEDLAADSAQSIAELAASVGSQASNAGGQAAAASASGESILTGETTNTGKQIASGGTTNTGSQTSNAGEVINTGSQTSNAGEATNAGSQTSNTGEATNTGSQTSNAGEATNTGSQTSNAGEQTRIGRFPLKNPNAADQGGRKKTLRKQKATAVNSESRFKFQVHGGRNYLMTGMNPKPAAQLNPVHFHIKNEQTTSLT